MLLMRRDVVGGRPVHLHFSRFRLAIILPRQGNVRGTCQGISGSNRISIVTQAEVLCPRAPIELMLHLMLRLRPFERRGTCPSEPADQQVEGKHDASASCGTKWVPEGTVPVESLHLVSIPTLLQHGQGGKNGL